MNTVESKKISMVIIFKPKDRMLFVSLQKIRTEFLASLFGEKKQRKKVAKQETYFKICTLLSVLCQVSAKFGTCTVVGLNWALVKAKMFTFTIENTHFVVNKCPI
jgi:hypothetical protein